MPSRRVGSNGSVGGSRGLGFLGRHTPRLLIRSFRPFTATSVALLSLLSGGCPCPDPPPAVTLFLNFDGTTLQSLPSGATPSMEDSSQNTVDFQMLPFGGYACGGNKPRRVARPARP
jgi:hypothetical protein